MKRLLLIVAAAILASCDDDSDLSSNPIDSTIIIEARERLDPDSRQLTLFCRTEKEYPCINFPLLTETDFDEDLLKISFTGVHETNLCFTAIGPAVTLVDLGSLPTGEYELELNNGTLISQGVLTLTDTEINFTFPQLNGIEFVREITKKVPENSYWGTIGYSNLSSSTLADAFIEALADNGAQFDKQVPGHYFYYEIDESGEIVADGENSGYHYVKAFIFQYDGDEADVGNLIQAEGNKYQGDLAVTVLSYRGSQFTGGGF